MATRSGAPASARVEQPAGERLEVDVGVGLVLEHRGGPAVLAGLDELVVPVGALDEPDRSARAPRSWAPEPARRSCRASAASRAGSPAAPCRRTGRRGTPSSASSSRISSSTASRESSDSMSMCRCAPRSLARRSSGRRRSAASRWPRSGASGRSSGVSAETLTERFVRGSAPAASCSSWGRAGQEADGGGERVERLRAAARVALGLGLRDGRLAEQVDGARDAVAPQVAQHAERGPRVLADDEAVRHPLDAAWRPPRRARRGRPSCCPCASRPRSAAGACSTSPRKPVRWRARSSSERQAGTTSTKRNSAALSSASWEARSIARSSSALSGLRVGGGSAS